MTAGIVAIFTEKLATYISIVVPSLILTQLPTLLHVCASLLNVKGVSPCRIRSLGARQNVVRDISNTTVI